MGKDEVVRLVLYHKRVTKFYLYVKLLIVAQNVLRIDEHTREREFGNLLPIKDNHPKYVISLDPVTIGSYKGIVPLHLRDFLKRNI